MLSYDEALEEDKYAPFYEGGDADDDDLLDGWDLDIPVEDLRPCLRLFAGRPANMTIRCRGDREILVHREIVTEVDYFRALLEGPFRERQATVVDVDEDVLLVFEIVRWIYCQDASTNKDTVVEVMRLAEFYGMEGLVQQCTRSMVACGFVKLEGGKSSDLVSADASAQGRGDLAGADSERHPRASDAAAAATVATASISSLVGDGAAESTRASVDVGANAVSGAVVNGANVGSPPETPISNVAAADVALVQDVPAAATSGSNEQTPTRALSAKLKDA
eukprot:TRINITY_DN63262_c0_g1_i1.p1 TRINITY_DN63262_c0_g1~~TRINITY_DN63262_c0_g1_i1.p1  ORF type:complete len:278 (+),score=54.63 TRINITY_DN63262_c0_g1_i1:133-966(+)